jgi:hypothetical protein
MRNTSVTLLFLSLVSGASAFVLPPDAGHKVTGWAALRAAAKSEDSSGPALAPEEEKVYGLLKEIHASQLAFRAVVVGHGAILESTNLLGPTLKVSKSPKSGANIATFASTDQSFEFHLMTAQVAKISLTEKQGPTGRTMRILRFTNKDAKPMCSLILADDSDKAAEWYQNIASKYGEEVEL